jgi:hypothetical protein
MRKFQVTSSKMAGPILITYNGDGLLQIADFSGSGASFEQVAYLVKKMPVLIDSLEGFCQTSNLEAVECDFEISFDSFWNEYGYKVERKRTEQLWKAMSKIKQLKAYMSIPAYKRFLKRKKIEQKYPDTYLRSEAFETEWDKVQ